MLITADLDFGLPDQISHQQAVAGRGEGTLPDDIADALAPWAAYLAAAPLVTVEPERHRVRILPIQSNESPARSS